MQSFGTDRILATRRVGDLPYHILSDIWNMVGALERNTLRRAGQGVEWLALRLQSLRRGHVERQRLQSRRIAMAVLGPFFNNSISTVIRLPMAQPRRLGSENASWNRLLQLDRYARMNPQMHPLRDDNWLHEIWAYNDWLDPGWWPGVREARDNWVANMGDQFTTLRIWLRRFRKGIQRLRDRRLLYWRRCRIINNSFRLACGD